MQKFQITNMENNIIYTNQKGFNPIFRLESPYLLPTDFPELFNNYQFNKEQFSF